jgi:hypothetical protein
MIAETSVLLPLPEAPTMPLSVLYGEVFDLQQGVSPARILSREAAADVGGGERVQPGPGALLQSKAYEREGENRKSDAESRGDDPPDPGVRQEGAAGVGVEEDRAPALFGGIPEAQEAQGSLQENSYIRGPHELGDHERKDHRQEVTAEYVEPARAHRLRGSDVVPPAHGEDLRAQLPGRSGPDDAGDDYDLCGEPRSQKDSYHDHQGQEGQRECDVYYPHQRRVYYSAGVPGDQTDHGADHGRGGRRRYTHDERDAGAEDETAQKVVPDVIGSERVREARRGEGRRYPGVGVVRGQERRESGDEHEETDYPEPDQSQPGYLSPVRDPRAGRCSETRHWLTPGRRTLGSSNG